MDLRESMLKWCMSVPLLSCVVQLFTSSDDPANPDASETSSPSAKAQQHFRQVQHLRFSWFQDDSFLGTFFLAVFVCIIFSYFWCLYDYVYCAMYLLMNNVMYTMPHSSPFCTWRANLQFSMIYESSRNKLRERRIKKVRKK